MHKRIAIIAALALLCLLGTAATEGVGVNLTAFEEIYAESVQFINQNTGRHLLPHDLTRDYDASGNRMYRLDKGALHMEMYLQEMTEQITRLIITLTAPAHMTYGDAEYYDFSVAGYHSYALIMAMSPETALEQRYSLVEMINWGIKQYGGTFDTRVGDYRLACVNAGGVVTLTFENDLLLPKETPVPEETAPAETQDAGEEEDAFLG